LRKFDELLHIDKIEGQTDPRSPVLFSVFLDSTRITFGKTLVFSVDMSVSSTEYEIDEFLFFDRKIPGEYLFRNTVVIRATSNADGWKIRYNLADDSWGESRGRKAEYDEKGFFIPLKSAKGFSGKLRLSVDKLQ
jgi:hypothetical protein